MAPVGPPGRLEVRRIFKTIRRRTILNDLSLGLERGEIVGLLGPNGAGKTTCFEIIAGLAAPDSGEVKMDGSEVTRLPLHRRARLGLSYLPQATSLFRQMTVEQNILAALEFQESNRTRRRQRLAELLDEFSITSIRQQSASTLSGGEMRRVEIARCLATEPSYILLDEPFAGIDPIMVGSIRRLVSDLKSRNIGVLVTDHNAREILTLCDRVNVIFEGNMLSQGYPHEVVGDENVRRLYLGEDFSYI